MHRLDGKLCLVTGAARGIGAAIARTLRAAGATPVMTDIDLPALAATAAALGAPFARLDVRSEADWAAFAADWPAIDVVVANAGITGFEDGPRAHDPEAVTLEDWRAVMATNLDGTLLACRYALRAMRGRGGAIVTIASRSGMVGVAGAAAYAASKAAVRNLTKSVALHGAPYGVRCNAICPAAILTPMWDPMLGTGDTRAGRMAEAVAGTPLARFGTPDEVAAAALWLASDAAAYVTGTEIVLDGGLLAGAGAA
ncbi:MAG: SDR family oxidoreductase [Gemmobacter sp.]